MLSLAVRSRLLCAPVATRAASRVACCIGNNNTDISARFQAPKSRVFSTLDGPKDGENEQDDDPALEDGQQPINGELSPLERLMQHSQQFQLDMDEEGESENDSEPKHDEGDDEDDDDDEDEPFASNWQSETSRPAPAFKRDPFRRRGLSDRQSKLGKMAVNRLAGKDMDELNYEAELENVWDEGELKLRKFHRALRREEDRDHVCTNCGERGHRSRNCLVPWICPNCGGLGHAAGQCRFRSTPKSIDEFLKREEYYHEKRKQSWKLRKKAARASKNPHMPRPKEVPTSDFNKRNESLRKELDDELDAYADMLEERARKRKTHKAQKDAQSDNATPES
ncbi:hypothetical protein PRIC1_007607 [Phytophthora ramorum]|uniref:uncharacterized protein n=1 Tax=Phytophthora ramorum TaxID=164328 RepID=UPI003094949B|nr:hypothetical protein KRP23_2230 [Phytophthora ramorum]KAH7502452.1 hypothetical protein KRP22_7918 [Phytophthora ramorum]